jgi:transcriptional regulator with XRE-family HTH domain
MIDATRDVVTLVRLPIVDTNLLKQDIDVKKESYMLDRVQLGKRIKDARLRTGMSQQQLANAIGVSDKTISAYEVGRVDPPLESLEKLSAATKHPIAYFIGDVQSNVEAQLDRIANELKEIREVLHKAPDRILQKPEEKPEIKEEKIEQIVEKVVEKPTERPQEKALLPAKESIELPAHTPAPELPRPSIPNPPVTTSPLFVQPQTTSAVAPDTTTMKQDQSTGV